MHQLEAQIQEHKQYIEMQQSASDMWKFPQATNIPHKYLETWCNLPSNNKRNTTFCSNHMVRNDMAHDMDDMAHEGART
jgi:hypothetical protein